MIFLFCSLKSSILYSTKTGLTSNHEKHRLRQNMATIPVLLKRMQKSLQPSTTSENHHRKRARSGLQRPTLAVVAVQLEPHRVQHSRRPTFVSRVRLERRSTRLGHRHRHSRRLHTSRLSRSTALDWRRWQSHTTALQSERFSTSIPRS